MKDALALLARYNTVANTRVFDLLSGQPAELLDRESGSYFHSITGVLNHILRSDINALIRFRNALPSARMLQHPALDIDPALPPGALLFNEFAPLRERRLAVDGLYEAFVSAADETVLSTEFSAKTFSGQEIHVQVGSNLLHMFNHATHHRGAISQMLDAMQIQNDFSSLRSAFE